MRPGTPVHIRWVDSCRYDHGWKPLSWWQEQLKPESLVHESLGFVVQVTDDFVAVGLSRGDVNACQVMQVPVRCVLELTEVEI